LLKIKDMKKLSFISIIGIFVSALIKFTIRGGIGWLGMIFIILKAVGVIHWSWWIAALPLEYGFFYCLYMTIDGVKYRAGLKDAGAYALFTSFTSPPSKQESENLQIQTIIMEGPDYIGETIERLCNVKNRMKFNQALLDASLEHYPLSQLAIRGNKNVNAERTIKKWKGAGLKLPEEGTPEFYPHDDKS
jgi:hypothetical protein